MNLTGPDLIGALVGFLLTIFVFTYIFGDNFLFRVAVYLFIGVAAGFTAVVVFYNVIIAQLFTPLFADPAGSLLLVPPLLLGLWLLFTKASPRLSRLGSPVMGYLVGAAAATAVGGVVLGTLFPQMLASSRLFDLSAAPPGAAPRLVFLLRGGLILLGTLSTLVYFQFSGKIRADAPAERPPWLEAIAQVGQVFIIITFGALFAGVYSAALTALIERLNALIELFRPFISS